MAMHKYMHPRNIYKTPPDFDKLANVYPEFSAVSKADVTGKITINFKDPHVLRILTKCLLKHDFNLDVEIPADRLVPTLPLRLNYILWIEDLLSSINCSETVNGLDIGTGACAIYPLLAAKKNKWHMVGTETDEQSILNAQENVTRNSLDKYITLRKNQTSSVIEFIFSDKDSQNYTFCMCNPPFYSSLQELYESRSPARPPPKNGFTGSPQELITEGGELEFCKKLISESSIYKHNITIYTTMVGHKYNLAELMQDLKAEGIKHTTTEFCQGRVTRWGLAWTYQDYELDRLVPPRDKPRKKNIPMTYILPELPNCTYNFEIALKKVISVLDTLSITHKVIEKRGSAVTLDVKAKTNTWSNQRRKRRLMKRIEEDDTKKLKLSSTDTSCHECTDEIKGKTEQKRTDITNYNSINEAICSNNNIQENGKTHITSNEDEVVLHSLLKIMKNKANDILLEMNYLNGGAGKDGLHQVVQYIKNNWK